MKVAVLNDNNKKLKMWSEFLPCAVKFSHPSFLFLEKVKDPNLNFDVLILDRMYHGQDLLQDNSLKNFRKAFEGVILILSSALHVEGEAVRGLDYVLDQWPVSLADLKGKLKL